MKKNFLTLVILIMGFGMVSADNDKPINVDQLPATAKQFITNHFSNKKMSFAKMESKLFDKSYEVIFTDGSKVEFDKKGEWKDVDCKFSQVPEKIIPQNIMSYVSTYYKDAKIIEIDRDKMAYDVKLNTGLELKFDLKFNLIEIDN